MSKYCFFYCGQSVDHERGMLREIYQKKKLKFYLPNNVLKEF